VCVKVACGGGEAWRRVKWFLRVIVRQVFQSVRGESFEVLEHSSGVKVWTSLPPHAERRPGDTARDVEGCVRCGRGCHRPPFVVGWSRALLGKKHAHEAGSGARETTGVSQAATIPFPKGTSC